MMAYLTRPRERFSNGKKVTGKFKIDPTASKDKQVLVQEGIYFKPKTGKFKVQLARGDGINKSVNSLAEAKKTLAAFEEEFPKKIAQIANPPEGSKKFLKGWMAERGVSKWGDLSREQKNNFVRTVWPNVQKQSKLIANKIPASEMAELLGIDKTVLDNSRKRGGIFAKEIEKVLGKPVNLIGKAGGTLGERGEYIYYDKPTSAQIKSLKTYIPKTFGQLTQDVTNRVRVLADDTQFMNDLKKIKTVDDVEKLKMLQTYTNKYPELNLTSGKLARATLLISQVAGGNAEYRGLDNIKPDKVLSKRLNNMIENAPFGNVYKKEAYDLAMRNIDQQFGSETATFSKYRDKIKSEFKRLGFKDFTKFNLDEYVGTSIGGFKGAGQYSVFSRLLAADINQKSGSSYLGRLSQATDNLEAALASSNGKITKEITEIVEKNMADALRTSKKTKDSLPYLSLKPPGSKENFGVKRLNQLEAQGLNFKKFYKERGFGFSGLKGAMTQKEIISRLEGLETGSLKGQDASLAQRLALLGCPGKAMGGRIGFQEGTTPTTRCVQAGANIINEGNVKNLSQGQRINAERFLKGAYKLGRNVAKFGVVPEAIFVAGESLLRVGMGDTFDEAFLRATDWLRTGDQTLEADARKVSRVFDQDAGNLFKSVSNFRKTKKDLEGAKVDLDVDLAQNNPEFSGMSDEDIRKIGEDRIKKAKDDFFNAQIAKEQQVLSDYLFDQSQDISKAKSFFTSQKLKGRQMGAIEDDPLQIDLTIEPEQKQSPFIDVRSVLTQTPESIANEINKAYQAGEYGQTGLEESFEKAKEDYSKTLNTFFNIKDAPLSELAASPVVGVEQIYGANPENFLQKILPPGASFDQRLAYDFAGGGIAKLAGIDSGPPPEKGPTPQGLDFLLKRGR